ncbi:hypothetical protein BN2475_420092 [Paraburkholderia ribeironis]|uniref:Uncharacterized protein n=1 Tax=Paraburkholderia ribeironis TaxID=1247936 RepID=A0A1N7S7U1_9BURK|nr:hypothetical protein BN2475_420092 [Paraburkholderia ribeironis]
MMEPAALLLPPRKPTEDPGPLVAGRTTAAAPLGGCWPGA